MDKVLELGVMTLFKKSRITSLEVPFSDTVGIAIGQGRVKAVILHCPTYLLNSATSRFANQKYIYYGDSEAQQTELELGKDSPLIFVNDLSEIFVRCPTAFNGANPVLLSVIQYE